MTLTGRAVTAAGSSSSFAILTRPDEFSRFSRSCTQKKVHEIANSAIVAGTAVCMRCTTRMQKVLATRRFSRAGSPLMPRNLFPRRVHKATSSNRSIAWKDALTPLYYHTLGRTLPARQPLYDTRIRILRVKCNYARLVTPRFKILLGYHHFLPPSTPGVACGIRMWQSLLLCSSGLQRLGLVELCVPLACHHRPAAAAPRGLNHLALPPSSP